MRGKQVKAKQRPKIDPEQPFVGIYHLGNTNVAVYGMTNAWDGSFHFVPDDKSLPRLKIGLKSNWWTVVAVATHEAFELLASEHRARFIADGNFLRASDTFWFHFNHNTFSQITEDLGYFLAKLLPDLEKTWKRYGPKQ